jgi:autotransporter adhesin
MTGAKYMVMDADVPVVESGGKNMTVRLDGADGAEVTNPPGEKHINAKLNKSGIVSIDASLFKSTPQGSQMRRYQSRMATVGEWLALEPH